MGRPLEARGLSAFPGRNVMTRKPECNVCDCGAHAWAPATLYGTVLVDREDQHLLERFGWHLLSPKRRSPYAGSGKAKNHLGHRLLHRAILDLPKSEIVDHWNGNGLDCRRKNLRVCLQKQNARNRRSHRGSTSRHLGVSWRTSESKWVAQIMVDGKKISLGRFTSEVDAASAYDAAAVRLFGDFARPNFEAVTR